MLLTKHLITSHYTITFEGLSVEKLAFCLCNGALKKDKMYYSSKMHFYIALWLVCVCVCVCVCACVCVCVCIFRSKLN